MEFSEFKDAIVVVNDGYKTNFIRNLRKEKKLLNVKVMGLNEFKKKFYFDYNKESVYRVKEKFSVVKSVAEMYIENLYFINDIEDEKIKFLKSIKEYLLSINALNIDYEFREFIKNKKIILYNLKYLDKFYEKMFQEVSSYAKIEIFTKREEEKTKKRIIACPNKESEISYVASEIVSLLKSGVDINHIKISNVENYKYPLKMTFDDFNIPLEIDFDMSIASTLLVKKFKELFTNDISKVMDSLREFVKTKRDEAIYKIIIDVLNEYTWSSDYNEVKDFIFSDLDEKKIPIKKYKNAVRVVDFINDEFDDGTYIFLLNFNRSVIPHVQMDESYLSDELKRQMSLSDSIDINKKRIKSVQEKIGYVKNLVVTYSLEEAGCEQYLSNAYMEELFTHEDMVIGFNHSNNFNKNTLVKEKDRFRKFGSLSKEYYILNNHYKDAAYMSYDNSFKGVEKENLQEFLKHKLVLSYSSMNTYYHCAFKYYLDNIIKVYDYENTFEIFVGNIMHHILSKIDDVNFDLDKMWDSEVANAEISIGAREKFFLKLLKEELKFILEYLNNQKENTELDKAMYEKKIEVKFNLGDNEILFKGFVDKILYSELNGKLVAVIVDYKTGNPNVLIDNSYNGLDMQLPVYAYLVKNSDSLKHAVIGGFYLEKILSNEKNIEKKKDYLKLQGYTNQDMEVVSFIDKTFQDSKMIKSMKVTSNGFSSYTKTLSNKEIDNLCRLVQKKILEACENILNGNFKINPKEIDNKLVGCSFCKYSDICFKNAKNHERLQKVSAKDFLGGDE